MKNIVLSGLVFGLASLICHGNALAKPFATQSIAQIVPDSSVGTTITPNVEIKGVGSDRIDGGTIRGGNLFHSFSEFNIQNGRGAYFTNPEGITNIFSRITGNNPSNINGILGVLGNANLFLLNPNGIIFGPHARLDLNGSFLGTTANNINFADGTIFSATNPLTAPLLTVSVPVGLGFGSNPNAIIVQGTGHNLRATNPNTAPINRSANNGGLQVKPGRTLALVGGDLVLNGGMLTAEQGIVLLGSIKAGQVNIYITSQGLALSYPNAVSFGDIQLSQRSLVDASGASAGSIQVQGRQVAIADGSVLLLQNQGTQSGGGIEVNATQSLELSGYLPDVRIRSSLNSETVGAGRSGDVNISTQRLIVREGAGINNRTFTAAEAGNININANGLLEVNGFAPAAVSAVSIVAARTVGAGNGGDLTISTQQLSILNGGVFAAPTAGSGVGGDVTINAEVVEVAGMTPTFNPSALGASSTNTGRAGSLTVNTRTFTVRNGGSVSTSSFSRGDSGSITINASESVEVTGRIEGALDPSQIRSAVTTPNAISQNTFGVSGTPSGASGNITINTPILKITDQGRVTVRNEGVGRGGTLTVNASSLLLDNRSNLTATTASGEGGNIVLRSQNLLLRNHSAITATAGGTGNGGNLTLNTNTLVALENSDITANAFQGQGGNIAIATQGIFRSTDSDITASSQLGLSGTINVSVLNANQQNVVAPPPSNFVSTDQVVANSCLARQGSSQSTLAIAGNGGLPETPETATIPYQVVQVQATETSQATPKPPESKATPTATPMWKPGDPIVEATEFSVNAQGQVVLTAKGNTGASTNAQPQPIPCQPN